MKKFSSISLGLNVRCMYVKYENSEYGAEQSYCHSSGRFEPLLNLDNIDVVLKKI